MLRSLISFVIASLALSAVLSCSSESGKRKGKSAPTSTSSKSNKKPSPKTVAEAGDDAAEDGCSTGKAMALQGAESYQAIVTIVASQCIGCHLTDSAPGNFTSPEGVKAKASSIKDRINRDAGAAGVMPPGGKLSETEIATIEAWIDAGAPLPSSITGVDTDSASGTGTGTDTDAASGTGTAAGTAASTAASDDCSASSGGGDVGGSDGTASADDDTDAGTDTAAGNNGVATGSEPIKEAFEPYVNPEEKKNCHDQGLAFYRDQDETHQFGRCYDGAQWPAPFECNREGVLKAFNNNAQVKTVLDEKDAKGWYYDDCGVMNGKPVVFFACYTKGDGVCVKIDAIAPTTLSILGEVLRTGG
jgi:hypothetical protein